MKENLKKRLLTVFIGVPACLCIIFLLPYYHFLAFSLFICLASLIGTYEMGKILFKQIVPFVFFSFLLPFSQYLVNQFSLNEIIPDLLFVFELMILFATEIKAGERDDFANSISVLSKSALMVIYPSYFLLYLIKLAGLETIDSFTLALFFILVFGNDIFAYIFGMLFGRNNAGFLKVSPKKSKAGFIGSFFTTIVLSSVLSTMLDSIVLRILLGILMSLAANIGDLVESVFKRSANIKDSGNLIPGRGGVLDCIDSICACAPVYYLILRMAL